MGQIGNSAGDFNKAKISAGGKSIFVDGGFEEQVPLTGEVGKSFEVRIFHVRIGVDVRDIFEAMGLDLTGG